MANPDRITVDIRGLREDMERLATKEERSLSNVARILISEALEARGQKSVDKQSYPVMDNQEETINSLVSQNLNRLRRAGIKNLEVIANGEVLPTKVDFCKIAAALGLSESEQKTIWARTFNNSPSLEGIPNGHS